MKKFFQKENNPLLLGLAVGLYPLLYFFSRKPDILNSWSHYLVVSLLFIGLPILTFYILKAIPWKKKITQKRAIAFAGFFYFFAFIQQIIFVHHHKKLLALIFVVAAVLAYFLYKHYKKFALLQLLLAVLTVPLLVNAFLIKASYSHAWTEQPDAIEKAVFKKKPNIYFIEPDGYSNFTELKKPLYRVDNAQFEQFLRKNNFTNYNNFRSNYTSTLSSNASFFSMKHHYFNNDLQSDEVQNARNIIMNDNPVLRIFKNNGYKTHFISDTHYLISNRPKTAYDASNFGFWDVSFIDNGIKNTREDVESAFKNLQQQTSKAPNFFFIQFLKPWHISGKASGSKGKEMERELWIERLEESNEIITSLVTDIRAKDPEGLIIIMADHGGYVGYNYSDESRTRLTDPDLITTVYNAALSIHWPQNEPPSFDDKITSAVNVFRVLFSYLTEDKKYLTHLQDNSSYMLLPDGEDKGIYSFINDKGEFVFKKHINRKE